jgi:HEAT repeat protein
MNEPAASPAADAATRPGNRAGLVLLALLGIAALVVVFEPTGVVRGHLSGETFFASRPASYWERQLLAGPAERFAARQALLAAGSPSVPMLIDWLDSGDSSEIRWTAAELLGRLGPDAADASETLLAALSDPDPHVQSVVAEVIPRVGTPAEQAVPALAAQLEGSHAPVAAYAISVYKAQAEPALPQLTDLLADTSRSADARWNAARTIGKTGPSAISALPVLIEMTGDREATVRGNSAEAIGDIGPTAVDGVPALITALRDPVPTVRFNAVRALGAIGPPAADAAEAIRQLLEDPDAKVKAQAQTSLEAVASQNAAVGSQ